MTPRQFTEQLVEITKQILLIQEEEITPDSPRIWEAQIRLEKVSEILEDIIKEIQSRFKFKVGDWIAVSKISETMDIQKILEFDEMNETYKCYSCKDKVIYNLDIYWLNYARLLTDEEKVQLL